MARKRRAGPIRPGQKLLSKRQVTELIGVAYSTLWGWMKNGAFPLAIELGPAGSRSATIAWDDSKFTAGSPPARGVSSACMSFAVRRRQSEGEGCGPEIRCERVGR